MLNNRLNRRNIGDLFQSTLSNDRFGITTFSHNNGKDFLAGCSRDCSRGNESNKGTECGVILNDAADLQQGDLLTCYEVVSRKIGLYDSAGGQEAGGKMRTGGEEE